MKVSVIICTWNRAALLDQTLAEMRKLRVPDGVDWELLVVNNNSTDATDEIIARQANCLPIRRIFAPRQGKSFACNLAIDSAEGDFIVWTDDDVLVDTEWLAAYLAAADRWSEAVYFGGLIEPYYECPPPSWVTANLGLLKGVLLVRDLGPAERPFIGDEEPSGASMAFRRSVFDNWRFSTRVGPAGESAVRGEDTMLIDDLKQQGKQGIWVPAARVRHFVPAARMTREYLWKWAYGWGIGLARMHAMRHGRPLCTGFPLRLRVTQARQLLRYWRARVLASNHWPIWYHHFAVTCGMLAELRSTSDSGSRSMEKRVELADALQ